jgi:MoaA/NifB/PqqE/SkfB family radical SAM enzyme
MTFLKVLPPESVRSQPLFVTTTAEVSFAGGFSDEEQDGADLFRWMSERGLLSFAPDPDARFLELWALSEFHDLSQRLIVTAGGRTDEHALVHGWSPLSLVVPAGADRAELRANKIFPREYYPTDTRTLTVRIRAPRLHKDPDRHVFIHRQYENSTLNVQEVLGGRTELSSTPPSLGIDLHGVCNVKPPCVYCEWDYSKNLEGNHVDIPFTRETLREWGEFFDNSVSLVNCSIGEPFMMKNFDELLDIFGTTGKVLEMTTNGQILTDRNIQKLLGRPIDLYISLDAATAVTYSRLRNDTFEKILNNLRRLIQAKGGRGRLPRVHLVFMPMRCNVHELDDFVRLCADLQADRMVLRPLNYSDSIALDWERADYHYVYKNELLPFDELVRVSGRAARLARAIGVELADQMDFGGSMRELFQEEYARGEHEVPGQAEARPHNAGEGLTAAQPAGAATPSVEVIQSVTPSPAPVPRLVEGPMPSLGGEHRPACLEPWKSMYILRRGVLPCCYGGKPIAQMEEYREAWNSPLMQGIRGELLQGRFHDYCLRSPACPIVRKSEQAHTLPLQQQAVLKARHVWWRLNRDFGNVPNRVWQPVKWAVVVARRSVSEPRYVRHHVKRILFKALGRQ